MWVFVHKFLTMQKSLGDIIAMLITDNTEQYRVINDYTLKVAFA